MNWFARNLVRLKETLEMKNGWIKNEIVVKKTAFFSTRVTVSVKTVWQAKQYPGN